MENIEVIDFNSIYDYEAFKKDFFNLSTINLNYYKEKQMKRRINELIVRKKFEDYQDYFNELKSNPNELKFFKNYITINVSDFFRTYDQWQNMENIALFDLSNRGKTIKAWSIACATGEEPYSLAISMMEKYPLSDIEILATDIDEEVLKKAKEGKFTLFQMKSVSEDIKEKYFINCKTYFKIKDFVKEKIKFEKLDLLKFNYPKNFDLIFARNVLIYFTEEAKDKVFIELNKSLNQNGYLFTGNTEQIIFYKQMNFKKVESFLYKK